jgi:carboxyl-terminal processing protease
MKKMGDIKDSATENRFTLIDVIFLVLIFSLLSIAVTTFIFKKKRTVTYNNDIDKVYNQIIDNYYEEVNKDELASSAIDGMMNYLGEKYSIYLDKNSAEYLNNELDGKYKGIGIIAYQDSTGIYVDDVMKNSPADSAGIQIGDKITYYADNKIDQSTKLDDILDYIKNHDEVALTITRNNSDILINLRTTDIDNPVVSSKLLTSGEDNYGYIYLESFTGASSIQFKNALDELEKNELKGLIIDVRSNKGGYLEQAHAIASMFIRKGKILYSVKDRYTDEIKYDDSEEHREYPVVVLVNSVTASASELLAISLKESYGAILVGTKTYGKGKVQQTSNIGDSSMIKYTTATWYSPNHNNIDGQGIRPGFEVKLNRAYLKNPIDKNDNQLKKALRVLVDSNK